MGDSNCLFCKMVSGAIPVPKVYEDDRFICIKDIRPKARIHLLLIPKKHVASLDTAFPEMGEAQSALIGELFKIGVKVARQKGMLPLGFRSIINTGEAGGQTVFHLHLHLLGGELLEE
jgi:histidine triad (HIT) family protein